MKFVKDKIQNSFWKAKVPTVHYQISLSWRCKYISQSFFLVKTIFEAVYNIIILFQLTVKITTDGNMQLTVKIFWIIMVKTLWIWILWMKKNWIAFFSCNLKSATSNSNSFISKLHQKNSNLSSQLSFNNVLLQHELNIFPEHLKLLDFAKFCSSYQFPLTSSYQGNDWMKIGNLTWQP